MIYTYNALTMRYEPSPGVQGNTALCNFLLDELVRAREEIDHLHRVQMALALPEGWTLDEAGEVCSPQGRVHRVVRPGW